MNTVHKGFTGPELAFMTSEEIDELHLQVYAAEQALNDCENIALKAEDRVNKENTSLGKEDKFKREETLGRIMIAQLTANLYSAREAVSRKKDKHLEWRKTRFIEWGSPIDEMLPVAAYLFRRKK